MRRLFYFIGISLLINTCFGVPIKLKNPTNTDIYVNFAIRTDGNITSNVQDYIIRANSEYTVAEVGHGIETIGVEIYSALTRQVNGANEASIISSIVSTGKNHPKKNNIFNILQDREVNRNYRYRYGVGQFAFYPSGDAHRSRSPSNRRNYRVCTSSEDIIFSVDSNGNVNANHERVNLTGPIKNYFRGEDIRR